MRSCLTGGLLLLFWALAACSDSTEGEGTSSFPENPGPITISVAQRGLPLELLRSTSSNRVKYETYAADASALFIYEQIWSEYVQATEGRVDAAELGNRFEDISSTYSTELARYGTHYLVVDLQRRDREWIEDWTGGVRDEPENRQESMSFARRDDYWVFVRDQLLGIVANTDLYGLIIGMEMNLYYDQNPGDWANYVDFYWSTVDALKAVKPGLRVAAGVNWMHFMSRQVASFVEGDERRTDMAPFQRAYEAIIDPLVHRLDGDGTIIGSADFVALAAIPEPADFGGSPDAIEDWYFGGLREIFPSGTLPIVWFQVGWPVSNAGSSVPDQFYQRFLELAGGTEIERVCWWGLTHLMTADCQPLTDEDVGASQTVCFRGLFSMTGADNAVANTYFTGE